MASLDGSNVTILSVIDFFGYSSAIDYSAHVLYATNFQDLWRVDIDSAAVVQLSVNLNIAPRGITVFGGFIYTSDGSDASPSRGGDIRKANITAINSTINLIDVFNDFCGLNSLPNGIKVITQQAEIEGKQEFFLTLK